MVVTRRAPVTPAPNSRTSSAQALPRVAKGKSTFDVAGNPVVDIEPKPEQDKKTKGKTTKWKRRKAKKTRTRGFFDFLTNVCIAALVIYSLSVCPQNQSPQPPLCHALSEYRRLVLEPYVFPYAQQALAHPSIAPYVETVKPYVVQAIDTATPLAIRVKDEFSTHVIPQWDNYVVPQWQKHVIPQYHAHIAPQLHKAEAQLEPYLIQAENKYNRYLSPYARLAVSSIDKWQRHAQPYVVLAANKSYEGYLIAKPYARPAWEQFKALVIQLIELAGKYRRQFVDPHVAKMWVKIIELSTGKKALSDPAITPEPKYSFQVQPTKVVTAAAEAFTEESTTSFLSEPSPTAITSEDDITETASIPVVAAQVDTYEEAAPPATIPEPQAPAVIPEETIPVPKETHSPIPAHVEEVAATPTQEVIAAVPTLDITGPSVTPSATPSTDDVDLDDFFAELGLDESETDDSAEQAIFSAPPQESDAEREAKLAALKQQTLEKRQAITARHNKWETDVDASIAEQRTALIKALATWRKLASVDLKRDEDIRKSVDGLVGHAEKYLKGAEGYLKNLAKEDRKEVEKKALWAKVVDKVDEKFTTKLQETEEVVNNWYGLVLRVELDEVDKAVAPVFDIAERGQSDIGLDYAWLEDVTYQDWQRYHGLLRKSEAFKDEALSMQNGTHASPLPNPVLLGIQDLRAEVEDIIVGFETTLRRIKRNGDRTFVDVEEVLKGNSEDVAEPEVSILPIVPEEEIIREAVPPVMIGKSQQEILQGLDNAGAHMKVETTQSPQEDVDEIVRAAESAVGHQEL